jgi:hypothetical protein
MSEEIETKTEESPALEEIPTIVGEIVEDDELQHLMPQMNVAQPEPPIENLIENEQLLGVYDEILGMLRDEHKQVTQYIDNFAEMVVNEGDATTSSKEALVNLLKIRSDLPDKMTKIADLMTRVKLKEKDTWKPYLNQTNNVAINVKSSQRSFIEQFKKKKKGGQ